MTRLILFMFLMVTVIISSSNAIKCYDKKVGKGRIPGIGAKDFNEDNGECTSNKWCVKQDGIVKTSAFEITGIVKRCADRADDFRCNEIGENCQKNKKDASGDFEICCCKGNLCNGSTTIYTSVALMFCVALGLFML